MRLRLICPERRARVFALGIVAAHERPEQCVERVMIEGVLRGSDAEGDVIEARERPSVTGPTGQKGDDRRRIIGARQRRTITEGDFHLAVRQRAREPARNRTVRAVSRDEHSAAPLFAVARAHSP